MHVLDVNLPFGDTAQISVMQGRPKIATEVDTYGNVVHDAYFGLLRESTPAFWVHPSRLYRICKSLPFPNRGVSACWAMIMGVSVKLTSMTITVTHGKAHASIRRV